MSGRQGILPGVEPLRFEILGQTEILEFRVWGWWRVEKQMGYSRDCSHKHAPHRFGLFSHLICGNVTHTSSSYGLYILGCSTHSRPCRSLFSKLSSPPLLPSQSRSLLTLFLSLFSPTLSFPLVSVSAQTVIVPSFSLFSLSFRPIAPFSPFLLSLTPKSLFLPLFYISCSDLSLSPVALILCPPHPYSC